MKNYIRHELSKIKRTMPGDDRCSAMHGIYKFLESHGYTTHEARVMIDEVLCENLKDLFHRLNVRLDLLKLNIGSNI